MRKEIICGLWSAILSMSLVGCVYGPDRAPNIRDEDPFAKRVYGCGAGFGDEVAAKLVAEYEDEKKKGNAGIEAARKTAASVLTLLPESDRLEGYKTYTSCISKDIEKETVSEKEATEMAIAACTGGFEANSSTKSSDLNYKANIDTVLLTKKEAKDLNPSAIYTMSLGDVSQIDPEKYKTYIDCVMSYRKLIKPNN